MSKLVVDVASSCSISSVGFKDLVEEHKMSVGEDLSRKLDVITAILRTTYKGIGTMIVQIIIHLVQTI